VKIWPVVQAILLSVIMPGMLESYCPKCGTRRIGQALRIPEYQTCYRCGAKLEIMDDGRQIGTDFSPFTADKYPPQPPDEGSKSDEQSEEKGKEQP
jgi:DNA-directed RNA polymerase subunit RPC12/RpoP